MMDRWTWHGGGLSAARRHFGGHAEDWLDLSTGVNPKPWASSEPVAIDWTRLPDEEALEDLERAAAAHFGCTDEHVCAVPGTELALRLIGRLLGGTGEVLAPSYRSHVEMFDTARCITLEQAAASGMGGGEEGVLVLANPNNPDGRTIDRASLLALHHAVPRRWLLVDEAYADVCPEMSLAGDVPDAERLVVLRSFGKFFGLAGLRLGFVVAPPAFLARLRAVLGAWPINAAAIAMAGSAYRDRSWIGAARTRLPIEAAKLDRVLQSHGYAPQGGCPLFRLVETEDAAFLFERLARHHILVRPFAEYSRWIRFGLPDSALSLERLDRALGDG
ncbi:threonine-phosphate decarboxylase CobD [Rhizorhabdus phycosphaerae]|uniref:threonine-phosphate decarboxylase CobD n=1 Tax=Rhizorhabdus phycosphaerae TaxID=2711156 RepID=UPI0019D29A8E|nr:threonine-phosphate decarboxylase CobD [Rhizorhabdus phycosphaerae]